MAAEKVTWRGMGREELDKQYKPSRWSKRMAADVVVDDHIRVLTEGTQLAQKSLKCELNVQYDHVSGQTLDIYYPPEAKVAATEHSPLLIYIHGGYWQALGLEQCGYLAPFLAKHGIITAAIGYDLAPKASMTTIVEQCRKGCKYIAEKFQGRRIYISGHSAGAHLSACMLTTDWAEFGLPSQPFSGAILTSGIYDLTPIQLSHVNDPLHLTNDEVRQFSPQFLLGKVPAALKQQGFSCLIAHGEDDSPEFKRQGVEYFEGLKEVGVSCSCHEIPNEDHFSLAEKLTESDYSLTKLMMEIINGH